TVGSTVIVFSFVAAGHLLLLALAALRGLLGGLLRLRLRRRAHQTHPDRVGRAAGERIDPHPEGLGDLEEDVPERVADALLVVADRARRQAALLRQLGLGQPGILAEFLETVS